MLTRPVGNITYNILTCVWKIQKCLQVFVNIGSPTPKSGIKHHLYSKWNIFYNLWHLYLNKNSTLTIIRIQILHINTRQTCENIYTKMTIIRRLNWALNSQKISLYLYKIILLFGLHKNGSGCEKDSTLKYKTYIAAPKYNCSNIECSISKR